MILISACVLVRSMHGMFDEVVKKMSQIKGVQKIFTVLGRYDVVVDFETTDMSTLGKAVLKMSRLAGVVFTETLVEVKEEG